MIHVLLDQLVNQAGVPQDMIYIGDPTNPFSGQFYDYLSPDFPDVHYMSNMAFDGREVVQFSAERMYWSTPDAAGKTPDYFTQYYANAEYFIDFAILKAHWAGITQCGKNHYGSMTRRPDAIGDGYYDMHASLSYKAPEYGQYRALVDLLGHEVTGGRALLYMIDGLWSGYGWGSAIPPTKWVSHPFNGDWPSSVLMSQDPIAIDSVGFDLWWEEDKANWDFYRTGPLVNKRNFPHIKGSCDYLIEGAMAHDPPSGTFYDPENDGVRMESLGVHEHHDGGFHYSGPAAGGIELVTSNPLPEVYVAGRHVFYNHSAFDDNDPAANAADDNAVAPDKTPLLPAAGATATFANYTGYDRGVNGIMVDIMNMPGVPTAADFECRVGDGTTWTGGPAPAVSVRPGAGVGGSDRVTLIFGDGAVRDTWLEVTVGATVATGLVQPDVFYVGNAPGDTGDSPADTRVTPADVDNCANNPRNFDLDDFVVLKVNWGAAGVGFGGGDYNRDGEVDLDDFVILKQNWGVAAAIDDPHDHNRDRRVDLADIDVAANNQTDETTCLPLMAFPEPPSEIVLIEAGSVWKYLDDGSDQGTAWRQPSYDDSGWDRGPAELGYGDGDEATVVGYGPDSDNKYVTTYFRHTFGLDDASAITTLTVDLIRDDAAVVYLNGTELARSNISGTVNYLSRPDSTAGSATESSWFILGGRDAGLLADGDNVVAVEIHQAAANSSDISFNLKLYQPAP